MVCCIYSTAVHIPQLKIILEIVKSSVHPACFTLKIKFHLLFWTCVNNVQMWDGTNLSRSSPSLRHQLSSVILIYIYFGRLYGLL